MSEPVQGKKKKKKKERKQNMAEVKVLVEWGAVHASEGADVAS